MADDHWEEKVIKVLLTRLDGRAKLSKVENSLYHVNLVRGKGMSEVLRRMSDSSRFLVFQKNRSVKYISVFCQDANICSAFRKLGYEKCRNSNCSKFHVCKYFISGNCIKSSNCRFGHDLQNETNKKVSNRLGLSSFSADELRTIISRSNPAVCLKYNTGGCDDDDCPDLHVCSRFMLQKCTAGAGCKFGHSLITSHHNLWVLDTFNVSHLTGEELKRIIPVRGILDADVNLRPQMTPATSSLSLLSSSTTTSSTSLAEEDTDEYVTRVFRFLLIGLGGRAQFSTFLTERRRHLQHMNKANIIRWLKDHMDRFILFESAGDGKYVSVYSRETKVCFMYNSSGCNNQSCKFFHICKRFVAGNCVNTRCSLSHSFSSGPNAKAYSDLKLDHFTINEVRKIFLYSSPAVCEYHNRKGCFQEVCTDLHVCARNLLSLCTSGDDCKFGHVIRDSGEHNSYVLKAFRMDTWDEHILRKLAIVKGDYLDTPEGATKSSLQASPTGGQRKESNKSLDFSRLVSVKDTVSSKYEYICETYTWTGACPSSSYCPRYHNPDRLPYLWLIEEEEQWRRAPASYSIDLETCFCDLGDVLNKKFATRGIQHMDFSAMSAIFEGITVKLKRLSTPSYVTAVPGTPLNFYTQWVWYRRERDGTYTPFYPGSLQYTLEEKYLKGQHKYFFEFEDLRLMVDTHSLPMTQTNLHTQGSTPICRRPVFEFTKKLQAPKMSSLLLAEVPSSVLHQVPKHWSAVDHFQDFELVELESADPEYSDVQRRFFSTMSMNEQKIVHMFRVQNPGLWDKYCSTRRAMTPRGQRPEDVDERQLFHGTPTLQAARGICANSFDFRRSGENVGAVHGKGAYFSTTARYSHSYTRAHTPVTGDPLRFMFLGRILVGQYTLGDPSYTKPPERDRLKLYDSCVNNLSTPTIFVIFDLAQSYPEYFIQYTDVVGKRQQSQVHTSASVPSLAQSQSSLHPLSRQSSLKMSSVMPSTARYKTSWVSLASSPPSTFSFSGSSTTAYAEITSTSSSIGSPSTAISSTFTASTGSPLFNTGTELHSSSTAVPSASASNKAFSTSTSSGPFPTSESTGPLPTSRYPGPLPNSRPSGPLPISTSSGPLPTSTSTIPLSTSTSSGALRTSTSSGPLPISTSSGPLPTSTASGPLSTPTSLGSLPTTSLGALPTSTSTELLPTSTSSGPLPTSTSTNLLPTSTSSVPLPISASTRPLPASGALLISTSSGPLLFSTTSGPLTTPTSTGSLPTSTSTAHQPSTTVSALQPTMALARQFPTTGPLQEPSVVAPVQTVSPTAHQPSIMAPADQPSTIVSRTANRSFDLATVQPVSHQSTTSPAVQPVSQQSTTSPAVQPVSHQSTILPAVQPVSHQSTTSPAVQPVSQKSTTSPAMQPVSQQSFNSPAVQPVSHQSTTSLAVQPLSQKSTTSPAVQPVSHQSTTSLAVQPLSQKSTTSPAVQPVSQKSTTSPAVQPVSHQSTTSLAVQPLSQKSTTSPAVQLVSQQSTTSLAVQPVSQKSTTSPAVQPVSHQSTTSPAVQPVSQKSTTSPAVQPVSHESTISPAVQPVSQQSTTSPPVQPVLQKSTTSPPVQPVSQQSTISPPVQPVSHQSTTSPPVQPVLQKSTTSPPVQPVLQKSTTSPAVQPLSHSPPVQPLSRSPHLTFAHSASGRALQTQTSSPYMGGPSGFVHLSLNNDPMSLSALDTFTNVSLSTWQDQSSSPVTKPRDRDRCVIS